MNDQTRRAIAYIVGRMVSGKTAAAVFDRSCSKQFGFTGDIAPTRVTVRDHEQNCDVTGAGGSGMYTVTHPTNGKPVSLKVKGSDFEGFDYRSAKKYRGNVSGNTISLHDDQVAQEFQYTL